MGQLQFTLYKYHRLNNVYFDTGITPTLNTRVEIDNAGAATLSGRYAASLFGSARRDWDNTAFEFQLHSSGTCNVKVGNAEFGGILSFVIGERYQISLSKSLAKIGDSSRTLNATSIDSNQYNIYINSINVSNSNFRGQDCYIGDVRIYENDVLVGEFKPCENNGTYTFYDTINDDFVNILGNGVIEAGEPLVPPVQDDSNVVPINKYKLGTSNVQKTYNGSTQINKMYVGNDLVYRALPTTTGPTITYVESITQDTDTCSGWLESSSIDTGVPHTTSTTTVRIKYTAKCDYSTGDIWNFADRIVGYVDYQSNKYFRIFGFQGGNFTYGTQNHNTSSRITSPNTSYDLTIGDSFVYNNINQTYLVQATTTGTVPSLNYHISVDVQYTNVEEVIIQDGNTVLFDGKAAYDSLGHIGLYDEVSQSMKYNSDLQMRYETL